VPQAVEQHTPISCAARFTGQRTIYGKRMSPAQRKRRSRALARYWPQTPETDAALSKAVKLAHKAVTAELTESSLRFYVSTRRS
jgi:hypothetical protein